MARSDITVNAMKKLDDYQIDKKLRILTFEHEIGGKVVWVHVAKQLNFDGKFSVGLSVSDPSQFLPEAKLASHVRKPKKTESQ